MLHGDLYVRGSGDPSLVVERLWKVVADLAASGVREIEGDLVLDATWLDEEHLIAGWDKPLDAALGPAYFAPVGGLTVNYNTVGIVVAPGFEEGAPARAYLETDADVLRAGQPSEHRRRR